MTEGHDVSVTSEKVNALMDYLRDTCAGPTEALATILMTAAMISVRTRYPGKAAEAQAEIHAMLDDCYAVAEKSEGETMQ